MDYNWQVVMEEMNLGSRSVTFAAETNAGSRTGSITPSMMGDSPINIPFTIEPSYGTIQPGKKADIKVRDCKRFAASRVRTYAGRSQWISSPSP